MPNFNRLFSSPRAISMALSALKMLKMLLGLVVMWLSMRYFGLSVERDAWVIAVGGLGVLLLSLYSPINDTFRTRFVFLREQKGEAETVKAAVALVCLVFVSLLIVSALIASLREYVAKALAPGFSGGDLLLVSAMLIGLLPFFVFEQTNNLFKALLNTYDSFFYPELMGLVASVVNILFIILFSSAIGIWSLVLASAVNTISLTLVLYVQLKKRIPLFAFLPLPSLKEAVPFLTFSLPVWLATFAMQFYLLLERAVCSKMTEGAVSAIDYARQVMNLPFLVFMSVIPTVLTPLLAKHFVRNEMEEYANALRGFVRVLMVFTLLVGAVMIAVPDRVSMFFFHYADVSFVQAMRTFGVAIFFVILSLILGQTLISQDRVINYVIGTVAGNAFSVAWCLAFPDSISSVALAYCLGQVIQTVVLFFCLGVVSKRALMADLAKLLCCGALGGLLLMKMDGFFPNELSQQTTFCVLALEGIILFLIVGSFFLAFFPSERKSILSKFCRTKD